MLDFNEFNLLLVRHGQSEINAKPDMIGQQADSKLTNIGKRQAQLLHTRFDRYFEEFDYIYSSDYLRAYDTAKITCPNDHDRIITTSALREYSAGEWVGSNRSKVVTSQVALRMGYMGNAFLPPGGESMFQVERRASQWLEDTILYNKEMCAEALQRKQEGMSKLNIIAFSHGMTIKCLLHHIMGFDQTFTWKLTIENTSLTRLSFGEEGWRLITINDRAHLL